ncbi:MAG: hypothetical protein M1831_002965 [Alyxoria varia]|nr:MAG: hypothetical protein M1831_002965 [Alyxoria varia]
MATSPALIDLPQELKSMIWTNYVDWRVGQATIPTPQNEVSFILKLDDLVRPSQTIHLLDIIVHFANLRNTNREIRNDIHHFLGANFIIELPGYNFLASLRDKGMSFLLSHRDLLSKTRHIRVRQGAINVWKWSAYLQTIHSNIPSLRSVQLVYDEEEVTREEKRADAPRWWMSYVEAFCLAFKDATACEVYGPVGDALQALIDQMNASTTQPVIRHRDSPFYSDGVRATMNKLNSPDVTKPVLEHKGNETAAIVTFAASDDLDAESQMLALEAHKLNPGMMERKKSTHSPTTASATPRPIPSLDDLEEQEKREAREAPDPFVRAK